MDRETREAVRTLISEQQKRVMAQERGRFVDEPDTDEEYVAAEHVHRGVLRHTSGRNAWWIS
jgi:hypothetical protein